MANKFVEAIIKNLQNSIDTNWNAGSIEQWVSYAKRMKHAIENSVTMLEALSTSNSFNESEVSKLKELIKYDVNTKTEIDKIKNITQC